MNLPLRLCAAATVAFAAAAAHAHGNVRCDPVPKDEMKPQMALQKQLSGQGWRVRQVKNYNGCYEVYGFDEKGAKVEAFFDPKTFERVEPKN